MDTAMLVGSFIPILAILFAGLILLVPIAGLTARFALKPAVEAFAQLRASPAQDRMVALLEQRVALLEQQLHSLESSVRHIEEKGEFDRSLAEGTAPRADDAPRQVPVFRPTT